MGQQCDFVQQLFEIVILSLQMDHSEMFDSSIAEQEKIVFQNEEKTIQNQRKAVKYANVNEIKAYERASQISNEKLKQIHPILFNNDSFTAPRRVHFISTTDENNFIIGDKKQDASTAIQKNANQIHIKLPVSNIFRQNILRLQLANLKKHVVFTVENREIVGQEKTIGFKYTFNLNQGNLVVKVWVQLEGVYKVWKEMEVPLPQNRVVLQFQEFNNQQTDVKVNDFIFHLVLKMPYSYENNYYFKHQDSVQIVKIQFKSISEGKYFEDTETHCSKQCQLI